MAILGLMLAAAASAATVPPPGDFVYIAAAATTDNRFDGISRSNDKTSADATVYYGRSDGLFAGTVVSSIDYGDYRGPDGEIDLFGGKHVHIGDATVTIEGLYSAFLDQKGHQPNYNFFEAQAAVSRPFASVTWTLNLDYSPNYSYGGGRAWDVRGSAEYPLTSWLKVKADFGGITVQRSQGHIYGDIGATTSWRRLSLDVRYVATNLDVAQCFYTKWCEPAVTATLSWRFLP